MAVNRLTKMTLLAENRHHDSLLKNLQRFQSVEIEDIFENQDNQEWLEAYFPALEEVDQTKEKPYGEHQIEKSIVFIRDNGSVKQKIKDLPRKSYTLNELEARFNEEALVSLLNQVAKLQKSWNENTKKLTYWQQAED